MDREQAAQRLIKLANLWLPYKRQYEQIPGLSLAIVDQGDIVFKDGYGYADVEGEEEAKPETCYKIASISKMFTAVAILQLRDKGKLELDDPITKYLPWFDLDTDETKTENITIRQILSHASGLCRNGMTPHWESDEFPSTEEIRDNLTEELTRLENLTQFKYSNYAFGLLGEVIKEASGRSYERYVREEIIDRLELSSTSARVKQDIRQELATAYTRALPGQEFNTLQEREEIPSPDTNFYISAAGLTSNVIDLAKFLTALFTEVDQGNELLSRESRKRMIKKQMETGGGGSYGLGIGIYQLEDRKIVGHSGGFTGHTTYAAYDLDNDLSVILFSNTFAYNLTDTVDGLFKFFYSLLDSGENFEMESGIDFDLEKYAGLYRNRWDDLLFLPVKDKLFVSHPTYHNPTLESLRLKPEKKDKFVIEGDNGFMNIGGLVKFKRDDDGQVKGMTWASTPYRKLS